VFDKEFKIEINNKIYNFVQIINSYEDVHKNSTFDLVWSTLDRKIFIHGLFIKYSIDKKNDLDLDLNYNLKFVKNNFKASIENPINLEQSLGFFKLCKFLFRNNNFESCELRYYIGFFSNFMPMYSQSRILNKKNNPKTKSFFVNFDGSKMSTIFEFDLYFQNPNEAAKHYLERLNFLCNNDIPICFEISKNKKITVNKTFYDYIKQEIKSILGN
jgi:hypothetical protein